MIWWTFFIVGSVFLTLILAGAFKKGKKSGPNESFKK